MFYSERECGEKANELLLHHGEENLVTIDHLVDVASLSGANLHA